MWKKYKDTIWNIILSIFCILSIIVLYGVNVSDCQAKKICRENCKPSKVLLCENKDNRLITFKAHDVVMVCDNPELKSYRIKK